MEVLLLIIGIFLILLSIIILYQEKKNTNEVLYSDDEFSKLLSEKKLEFEKDSTDIKVEKINKMEDEINSFNFSNSESEIKNKYKNDLEREGLFNLLKNNEIETIDNNRENSKKNYLEDRNIDDRVLGYRDGRSLIINREETNNDLFSKINSLEDQGYTTSDIAKKFDKGVREIEIIKKLNSKS